MPNGNHDPLVFRLSQILIKLNNGEKLYRDSLAGEFGVTIRTIQRDLNVRLAYLPIEKEGTSYWLDPIYLGKITLKDVRHFSELAGVAGLFPSLSTDFLRELFDSRIQSPILIKGHHYENLSDRNKEFQLLKKAISSNQCINFNYKKDSIKPYTGVEPYKLINSKGIWYLAGKHDEKVKTFSFSKIGKIQLQNQFFEADPAIENTLKQEDGIWLNNNKLDVLLKISQKAADYFKRRALIDNQVIEEELSSGELIISAKIGHPDQIIPIIRYWIPHITVLSPATIKEKVEQSLHQYLNSLHPL